MNDKLYSWTDEQLQDAYNYYNNPENLAKINQYLENRETIFKSPNGCIIRCIKSNNAKYLLENFKRYEMIHSDCYNIYNSIASYKDFPLFSWSPPKRKEQYEDWTKNERYKQMINCYDFYMDFDNKKDGFIDLELVKQEVLTVSELLTSINKNPDVPNHQIRCSGSGFHIKTKLSKDNQTPDYCLRMCQKLIDKFGLETVDTSIYRWQGIIKTPYTIDFKTMRICKPIKLDEVKHFRYEDVELKNFL